MIDLGPVTEFITQAIPPVAAFAGGAIVKRASKKRGSQAHKVLSPAAAFVLGIAAALLGGSPDVLQVGGQSATLAIAGHTVGKNILQAAAGGRKGAK
jgi:hypothetical protein